MDRIINLINGNDNKDFKLEKNEERKDKLKVKTVEVAPMFKIKDDYCEAPHPNLLRLPFSLLEVAPKGSGKTVLLHNLIVWYYRMFDTIFIWSPTVNMDVKWRKLIEELNIPEENLFIDYNDAEVEMLMEKIKHRNEGKDNKEKLRVLFVFDDIIDKLPKNVKECALNKLAFNHRHYNISHIIVSQSFKKLDCNIRSNTTGIILFNSDNSAERRKIVEELCGNLGTDLFYKHYKDCVKEKFSFMFINYDSRKVFHKFSKEIANLDDINEDTY